MWKETSVLDKTQKPTWKIDWRREERRVVCSSGVPYDHIIFSATTLFLFCFASLFILQRCIPIQLPPFSKTLETCISPFCSFPFSIPFFLFIFSQGCNTVSFRKERSRGKKTQFREINLPVPPPLPSLVWKFVYKLTLLSSFFVLFCSPLQLI
jgi:hypothetical protein